MNREELVEALDLAYPALSKNKLVPILSHYWFRNNRLMAYNDKIAISTKFVSDFQGTTPTTLAALLSASRAKEVDFSLNKTELVVKAASAKFRVPTLPVEQTHIFEMPQADPMSALPVDVWFFLEAVRSCMRSMKEVPTIPDSAGITVECAGNDLLLYATNDVTISHAAVELRGAAPFSRVLLSWEFCKQMLAIAKVYEIVHLEIGSDYSLLVCGDTSLFGRNFHIPRPLDFASVIRNDGASSGSVAVQIPTKLELILDRASIITNPKRGPAFTQITVKDGVANFYSHSEGRGEVRDVMQLEGHPDAQISVDPRLLSAGCGSFDKILITGSCVVMSNSVGMYLVSGKQL